MQTDVIICGDCLEILRDFEDNSVDLVLTDPPYGIGTADWDNFIDPSVWLSSCLRVAPVTLVFCSIGRVWSYPEPRWVLAWTRNNSTQRNGTGGFNHWEPVLVYGKQKFTVDMFRALDMGGHKYHPSVKPLQAMLWLINQTEATTILDPFCGSGTTCVAAKMLGRHYIGIDISEKYCQIARKRVEAAEKGITVKELERGQGVLFGDKGRLFYRNRNAQNRDNHQCQRIGKINS